MVTIVGDVTKSDHVNTIYDFAASKLGPVDGLVSNAGFIISRSVHETSEDEWDSVMNANAKSFFPMARRALPRCSHAAGICGVSQSVVVVRSDMEGSASMRAVRKSRTILTRWGMFRREG